VNRVRVGAQLVPSNEPAPAESVRLARRAGAGDEFARRQLFRELASRVHATLYRVLGSNDHIEVVLENTFVEVFRSLPSYRVDTPMTLWAERIAIRVACRFLRSYPKTLARQPARPMLYLVGSETPQREGVRRLYAVLNTVKPQLRVAFALCALDGRSPKDIAELTGVSVVTVKSRVWRVRRQLEQVARKDRVLARYLARKEE
jgi:RNA polymerase sigma-70 factor, ECF subfamily